MYEGEFSADCKHGQGKYTYASGDVYDGAWVGDICEGRGVMHFLDGSVYEGNSVILEVYTI